MLVSHSIVYLLLLMGRVQLTHKSIPRCSSCHRALRLTSGAAGSSVSLYTSYARSLIYSCRSFFRLLDLALFQ